MDMEFLAFASFALLVLAWIFAPAAPAAVTDTTIVEPKAA
jgi:hypothetical protein